MKTETTIKVNGLSYLVEIEPHATLSRTVRDVIGLTGTKEGCDDSECGACMMLLDGKPVNSCSYLALQAAGSEITTVEGLSIGDELTKMQKSFLECGGVQCGFCTPGMLISATALLAANPNPSETDVRIGLSGNLCRCTGYDGIVKAVLASANHDENQFEDGGSFNMARPKSSSATFGFGSHFCAGKWFAKAQIEIALRVLIDRYPALRIDPEQVPVFRGWEFRAPTSLNVILN